MLAHVQVGWLILRQAESEQLTCRAFTTMPSREQLLVIYALLQAVVEDHVLNS